MSDATTPGLREYLRVLREQRVLIVAVAVVFVGVAVAISARQDEKYRAEAKLVFQDPLTATDAIGTALPLRTSAEQRATIGAETVLRPQTQAAVLARLKRQPDAEVSSRAELRTGLVIVQATSGDPGEAATVANAFAQETRRSAVRAFRREIDALARQSRREFRAPRGNVSDLYREVTRAESQRRLAQLRILRRLGEPVQVASLANPPSSPVSPKPVRNAIFGLIAGLTLGLVAAFGRSSLDRRLRTAEDVSDVTDLPLLGALRDDALGRFLSPGDPETAADVENVRIVRRNIELLDLDGEITTVLITSSVPEEGKSTVASGIAVASALSGKRTLLVECDLRRPVLAARAGIDAEPGLTDYLTRSATPQEIVRTVVVGGKELDTNGNGASPSARLAMITAGQALPQSAELLGSGRFEAFLGEVRQAYDLIVLDTPPLLAVADTLEILNQADAVVLCARSGRVQRNQLAAARHALETAQVRRAGVVLTGFAPGRDDETYGSYSYAYSPTYAARA